MCGDGGGELLGVVMCDGVWVFSVNVDEPYYRDGRGREVVRGEWGLVRMFVRDYVLYLDRKGYSVV
jgi:hypothetical protein